MPLPPDEKMLTGTFTPSPEAASLTRAPHIVRDSTPITVRFITDGTISRANFPGAYGLGVRRTTLHALMVERASEAGVNLLWNTPMRELDTTNARWIVGADGMNSRVRHWAGFGERRPGARRFGFRRRRVGNLSSASVLFVLEEAMSHRPEPGTLSLLAAMGPGFCSELVLLKW
jgi:hypothetical protein